MGPTPLLKKLLLKPGMHALLLNPPIGYSDLFHEPAPDSTAGPDARYDWVQLFAKDRSELDLFAGVALGAVKEQGILWITYPKKTSNLMSDLNRDVNWEHLLQSTWRPVTQIAIDDTWSALRFRPSAQVKSSRG